uniref:F-box domain-containing protein n=1 Tax=Oryza meridionalis TaxID=40149 RepID=A0A0E0EFV9_9ORYZ
MMKQRQTVGNLDIDGDLTYEILLRLPAKTVLRCGAVCKAWRHITTNLTFLSDHAHHRPPEALLYNSFGKATSKINMELDALSVAAHHQAAVPERRRLACFPRYKNRGTGRLPRTGVSEQYCPLLASCNGLLLFRKGIDHYVIYNPVTRQWAEFPRLTGGRNLMECHRESGFYFHPQSGEYRLLCHCTMNRAVYYMVLSVGGDEPRRLDVEATEIELFSTTQYTRSMMTPGALHGHLHWLQHPEGRLTNHMAVFNMVDETFKQMTSPPVTSKFFADLLATDKFLMASEFTDLGVDLWVMEGYGAMDDRWELRHRVVLPWMRGVTLERPLLIEGGNDGDVIMGTAYGLGVYNVKSKTFRIVITVKPPDALLLSRNMLRESLVPHTFFDNQQHHPTCLPLFHFLS